MAAGIGRRAGKRMDSQSLKRNLGSALFAQTVIFAVSAIMSLVVPKILGVEEFAYWQLFLLYISYVALFHLGLNDGVYLINGGKTYDEMDRGSIAGQFFAGITFEAIMGVCVFALSAFSVGDSDRSFVIGAFCVFIVVFNIGAYWGAVCQAANETHIYSKMLTLDRCLFLIPLLVGVVTGVASFKFYVVCYIVARGIAAAYITFRCRFFFRSAIPRISVVTRECLNSIGVGIKLTISYLSSVFILGVARFVTDGAWGIESFGQLSFAVSLLNFFIAFVNQVGMVLFPALRRVTAEEFKSTLKRLVSALDFILPFIYVIYFPVLLLAQWWLPQYQPGLEWLSVLLPVCVYNSRMEIVSTTAMKVLRKETSLMAINIGAALLSLTSGCICGFCLNNMTLLVWSLVFVVILRSLVAEAYVSRIIDESARTSMISGLFVTIAYLVVQALFGVWQATLAALSALCLIIALRRRELSRLLRR